MCWPKNLSLFKVIPPLLLQFSYYHSLPKILFKLSVQSRSSLFHSSIVGSIGAVSASFGLHDAIGRLGIERRILTAGKNKFANDPFQPWLPKDKEITQNILNQVHLYF